MPILLAGLGFVLIAAAFNLFVQAADKSDFWVPAYLCFSFGVVAFLGACYCQLKTDKKRAEKAEKREKEAEARGLREIARFEEEKSHWESIKPNPSINQVARKRPEEDVDAAS